MSTRPKSQIAERVAPLGFVWRRTFTALIGLALLLSLIASDLAYAQGRTRVRGYVRKDGTYVAPHYRTLPDGIKSNNYSYPGNFNPNKSTITPIPGNDVWVDGYFRADGTYVNGHYRSAPNSTSLPRLQSQQSPSLPKGNPSSGTPSVEPVDDWQSRQQAENSARAKYWKERGYEFNPQFMTAYAMDQKVQDIERAKYWKEQGYNFDPDFMTAYGMDQKAKDIERATYWKERGYSFEPDFMTAYGMDQKVKDIERAKYWKERGYSFDPDFMTAYGMDQKVKDIERAKYWKERGYSFDPDFMTAYGMDQRVREATQGK